MLSTLLFLESSNEKELISVSYVRYYHNKYSFIEQVKTCFLYSIDFLKILGKLLNNLTTGIFSQSFRNIVIQSPDKINCQSVSWMG